MALLLALAGLVVGITALVIASRARRTADANRQRLTELHRRVLLMDQAEVERPAKPTPSATIDALRGRQRKSETVTAGADGHGSTAGRARRLPVTPSHKSKPEREPVAAAADTQRRPQSGVSDRSTVGRRF